MKKKNDNLWVIFGSPIILFLIFLMFWEYGFQDPNIIWGIKTGLFTSLLFGIYIVFISLNIKKNENFKKKKIVTMGLLVVFILLLVPPTIVSNYKGLDYRVVDVISSLINIILIIIFALISKLFKKK